jgi:hypothetical protein
VTWIDFQRPDPDGIVNCRVLKTLEMDAVVDVARMLGIAEQIYYRRRKEYGGMRVDQAKRLKGLEKENTWLKKLVVEKVIH